MEDNELKLEDLFSLMKGFIRKNMFFILGFFILGLVFGVYKYSVANPEYTTNVYAKSEFIPIELVKNEIYSVNSLIKERNYVQLVDMLGIDSILVLNLLSCEYYAVSSEDKLFSIKVKSTGEENMNSQFVDHLVAYLEGNVYISKYLAEQKEKIDLSIAVYEGELEKLTQIQSSVLGENTQKSNYSLITSPSSLSDQIVKQKNALLGLKLLSEKVVVLSVIDSISIKDNPSLKMLVLSAAIVFTFFGICLIVLFRFFKAS
jgi:hypothetical protein